MSCWVSLYIRYRIKRYMREIFFFKQKTAYEMRISDWSSDVCSSDLPRSEDEVVLMQSEAADPDQREVVAAAHVDHRVDAHLHREIGRASCRERVCQYV